MQQHGILSISESAFTFCQLKAEGFFFFLHCVQTSDESILTKILKCDQMQKCKKKKKYGGLFLNNDKLIFPKFAENTLGHEKL